METPWNEGCEGCLSSYRYSSSYSKCKFVNMWIGKGYATIPNCECKTCLLKMICTNMCDEFMVKWLNMKQTIPNKTKYQIKPGKETD
jgi:hypothetical protein